MVILADVCQPYHEEANVAPGYLEPIYVGCSESEANLPYEDADFPFEFGASANSYNIVPADQAEVDGLDLDFYRSLWPSFYNDAANSNQGIRLEKRLFTQDYFAEAALRLNNVFNRPGTWQVSFDFKTLIGGVTGDLSLTVGVDGHIDWGRQAQAVPPYNTAWRSFNGFFIISTERLQYNRHLLIQFRGYDVKPSDLFLIKNLQIVKAI